MISITTHYRTPIIAEALMGEAVFTHANAIRPIVATYGCGPCIALGGYDPTNKNAFIVHLTNENEILNDGKLLTDTISKLAQTTITQSMQIHLRGGYRGWSENMIDAIKDWVKTNEMTIASDETMFSPLEMDSKSLLIDSRTGEIGEYDPLTNPHRRHFDEFIRQEGKINISYTPNN